MDAQSNGLYTKIKEAILNPKVSKKTFGQLADEKCKAFKSTILALKSAMKLRKEGKQDAYDIKASITDLPSEFFRSNFDAFYFTSNDSSMSFQEYADNRDNFEFLKEFNRLNELQPHVYLMNTKT